MQELTGHGCSMYHGSQHLLAKLVNFWQQTDQEFICYLPKNLQLELNNQIPQNCLQDLKQITVLFANSLEGKQANIKQELRIEGENILIPVNLVMNTVTKEQFFCWERNFAEQLLTGNNSLVCLYDIFELIENKQEDNLSLKQLLDVHDYLLSTDKVYYLVENNLNEKKAF